MVGVNLFKQKLLRANKVQGHFSSRRRQREDNSSDLSRRCGGRQVVYEGSKKKGISYESRSLLK